MPAAAVFSVARLKDPEDRARLLRLWHQRTADGATADFVLGPGDVIEISVPVIAELKDRTERVTGNGTVLLPYVGTVKAAGLTEKQLKAEIAAKLSAIMYRPQIDLFVKEYRSRQVAVVGQVDKPGLYDLASPNDTLFDMLNEAGGINKDAALRVLFIPAHENQNKPVAQQGVSPPPPPKMNVATASAQSMTQLRRHSNPIVIGLGDLSTGGNSAALMLPARPGDMLVVPGAGEVVVEGWVDKPGSYKITPGLTLAGAVGAAGGALFAAKESSITIMREGPDGKRLFIDANLASIDTGEAADIPVQEGDVVSVPYSAMKLLPYAALSLIGKGIYFSAAAPVF
jgi:polysaccharide export outer membrane protein